MMKLGDSFARLSILALTVAILLVLAWRFQPAVATWHEEQLAMRIANQINDARDEEASAMLYRLADLGPVALRSLVTAARSPCEQVAGGARKILSGKLDSWVLQVQANERFEIAKPAKLLSAALADEIESFDISGRQWAETIALRIIDLSRTTTSEDSAQLLEDCDRVLAAVPATGPRLRNVPESTQVQLTTSTLQLNVPGVQLDALALSGEGARQIFSPSEEYSRTAADLQIVSEAEEPAAVFSGESVVPETVESGPSDWLPQWVTDPRVKKKNKPKTRRSDEVTTRNLQRSNETIPLNADSGLVDVPTPKDMAERQRELSKKTSEMLIAQLPEAGRYEAGAIRAVLRARGLTKTELRLAQMLSSPRLADRVQLLDAIAELPAGKTRKWLRWLLDDNDAEIRLRALTALATTDDPELFQIASELASTDQDKRVTELATRIIRQVR